MIGSRKLQRVAIVVVFCAGTAFGQVQETESHRRLRRPGMDTRGVQLRLELLQRLQEIARDRQKRGLPPLDMKKLSNEVKQKLDQVQKEDKELRDQLEQAQQNRSGSNAPQSSQRQLQPPQQQPTPGQRSTPLSPNGNFPSPDASPRPGSGGSPEPPSSQLDDETIEKLKKLQEWARNRRRSNGGSAGNDRSSDRPPAADSRNTRPRSPVGNQSNRSPQNGGGASRSGGNESHRPLSPEDVDGFDMAEYLKRLENLPPLPDSSGSNRPRNSNGTRRNPGRSGNSSSSPSSGRQPSSRSTKKKNPLSKNSLKKFWDRAKNAPGETRKKLENGQSKSSQGTNTSKPPPNIEANNLPSDSSRPGESSPKSAGKGFFDGAMRRTAEGMIDQIGEAFQKNKNSGRQRNGNKGAGGSRSPSMFDSVKRAGKKTGDFFGNASRKVSNLGGGGGGVSMPSGPDPSTFVPFLVIAAIVAGAWFLLRQLSSSHPEPALVGNAPTALPKTVSTRQDVIDAFHFIASKSPAVKGNWWTHSRVAKALRKLMPNRTDAISNLKRVYETARYLPPDAELSSDQIQAARDAIERCST